MLGHVLLPLDILSNAGIILKLAKQCNPHTNLELRGTIWST